MGMEICGRPRKLARPAWKSPYLSFMAALWHGLLSNGIEANFDSNFGALKDIAVFGRSKFRLATGSAWCTTLQ
jgi:hypothetical protein